MEAAEAEAAHRDLVALDIALHAYPPLGERIWELHPNVSAYDAAYVALAEVCDAPLATLDHRLARSTGPTCEFLTPR